MPAQTVGPITDLRSGIHWGRDALQAEITRRRAALAGVGVGQGTRVALAHGGTPAFFADLFACWSLRAAALCLNPSLTRPELATIVDFAHPKAVLVADGLPSPPTEGLAVPVLDAGRGRVGEMPPATGTLMAQDPALILFTSGTTGDPKGVVLTAGGSPRGWPTTAPG